MSQKRNELAAESTPRGDTQRNRRWLVRTLPIILLLSLISITLIFIYSNHLYRAMGFTTTYESEISVGSYQISLSAERTFKMPDKSKPKLRDLRISFPLSAQTRACELLYGAAIYNFQYNQNKWPMQGQFIFTNPRYLIKFKYDLKNKRCESKDLFILSDDVPEKITIQLIRSELSDTDLREAPVEQGIEVTFPKSAANIRSHKLAMQASLKNISPVAPFITSSVTKRNLLFSVPKLGPTSVLIHPYDSLNDFIIDEANRRIAKCRNTGVCDKILAAVAKITDRRFLKVFEDARRVGIPIELIANFRYRIDMEADDFDSQAEAFTYSPWMWLRGSPYSKYGVGHLPMHTKFVVFGDDLVVSSNPSLRAGNRSRSREYSIIYRDPAVAKIFSEIFTLVRTSLYYPLKVNIHDDLQILFNADRPRQYSASIEKPYVAIDTDEGVRTSAYGVLYELLARTPGKLAVVMSPITNSCAPYRTEHCLFEILEDRAKENKLDMVLNGYYYLPESSLVVNPAGLEHWTTPKFVAALKDNTAFRTFSRWFAPDLSEPRIYIDNLMPVSTHHERLGLLGNDISILGSANWATTATVNTIEVIRSPEINAQLQKDLATFDEPWFVSMRTDTWQSAFRYGDCDFSFEIGAAAYPETSPFLVRKEDLLKELLGRYPGAATGNLAIIEPRSDRVVAELTQRGAATTDSVQLFDRRPLGEDFESHSAYLCLEDALAHKTYVLRVYRP